LPKKTPSNIEFRENPFSESRGACRRTGKTKLMVDFRNFALQNGEMTVTYVV